MPKILSQAGTSLADVYDVEGSVAGIDNLESAEVQLVHELGAQIHSERLQTFLVSISSGTVAQNSTWSVDAGAFPDSTNRFLGAYVTTDTTAEIAHCSLSMRDRSATENAFPLWAWDDVVDAEYAIRILQAGSTGNRIGLAPRPSLYPFQSILTRQGDNRMPLLSFNGLTNGFGAGTNTAICTIMLARPDPGNPAPGHPSSHGLPIPSW